MLAALWLAPLPAAAQSPKELAAAKQAFKEGEDAEARGDLPTALARFQKALAVKETPQLHLHVGLVEEKMGRLNDALGSYQRGLDRAGSLPAVAKVAREQLEALRPRIPRVTATAATPPPGFAATLDGAPLPLGTAVAGEPGPHRPHAEAPGYAPRDESCTGAERAARGFSLDLVPVQAAPPPDTGSSRVPGAVLLAGGAVAVIVGAGLLGGSYAKDASINQQCKGPQRTMCPLSQKDSILAAVSMVNAMRFSGIGVGVLGLAGVAAGAALLVQAGRPAAATGVAVAPVVGEGTAGVVVMGRF